MTAPLPWAVDDTPPPLLTVSGLDASFGPVRALNGVNLTVQPGQLIALAGDAPHQRRLARAVLAGQGDKLARLHGEVDVVESAHRPEAGVEPRHCQQRGRRLVDVTREKRGHLESSSLIQRLTPGTLGHCGTWAPAPPSLAGRGPIP